MKNSGVRIETQVHRLDFSGFQSQCGQRMLGPSVPASTSTGRIAGASGDWGPWCSAWRLTAFQPCCHGARARANQKSVIWVQLVFGVGVEPVLAAA